MSRPTMKPTEEAWRNMRAEIEREGAAFVANALGVSTSWCRAQRVQIAPRKCFRENAERINRLYGANHVTIRHAAPDMPKLDKSQAFAVLRRMIKAIAPMDPGDEKVVMDIIDTVERL